MTPADVEMELPESLVRAVRSIPPGRWAMGVSGGADSIALLHLVHRYRKDVTLCVVHIDHETRNGESARDAQFVEALAWSLDLRVEVAVRRELEPQVGCDASNISAVFRECRLMMFRWVVHGQNLQGVLLAHHADDQAESVMLRLLRGNGYTGLVGMSERSVVEGVTLVRPLLGVRRAELRAWLTSINQRWREDLSNASGDYARNRVRQVLATRPELTEALLDVSASFDRLRAWVSDTAPVLSNAFRVTDVTGLAGLLASESVRRWLVGRGVPVDRVDRPTLARLMEMITDAGTTSVRTFPRGMRVRRRRGVIDVMPKPNRS